jgi:hypothetical protein
LEPPTFPGRFSFSDARSVLKQGTETRSAIQGEVTRVTSARARFKRNLGRSVSPVLLWGIAYALGLAVGWGVWGVIIAVVFFGEEGEYGRAAGAGFRWGAIVGVVHSWLIGLLEVHGVWLDGDD